jgi:hypothetical protein
MLTSSGRSGACCRCLGANGSLHPHLMHSTTPSCVSADSHQVTVGYRNAPKYYRKRKRTKRFSAIDLQNEKIRFLFPVILKNNNKNA